jgi:hypothetical protein
MIHRYDLEKGEYGWGLEEWDTGQWVKFPDHESALAEKDKEIQRWRDMCEKMAANLQAQAIILEADIGMQDCRCPEYCNKCADTKRAKRMRNLLSAYNKMKEA